MPKKKMSSRNRWLIAIGLSVAAAAGVGAQMPTGTRPFQIACAMIYAGLPVLVMRLLHPEDPVAASPVAGVQP